MSKQAKRQMAGSGEALPAGVAGEVTAEVNISTSQVPAANGTLYTFATLTIPSAGIWQVYVSGELVLQSTITNCAVIGKIVAGTGSPTIVAGTDGCVLGSGPITAALYAPYNKSAIVRCTGSCTVLFQTGSVASLSGNVASLVGFYNGTMYAVRIA